MARTRHVAREGAWEQVPGAGAGSRCRRQRHPAPPPRGPAPLPTPVHFAGQRPPRLPGSRTPAPHTLQGALGSALRRVFGGGARSVRFVDLNQCGTFCISPGQSRFACRPLTIYVTAWQEHPGAGSRSPPHLPPAALPSLSGSRRSRLRNGDGTPPSMASRENPAAPDVGDSQQSEGS